MLQTMTMPTAERMSGVDRAWLLMDHPSNPMTVIGLLVLAEPLGRDALRELITRSFLRFERFRCIPVTESTGGEWVESPHFNVDDHLWSVALPAPAEQPQLEALLGELASTPFNRDRPLWSFHLITKYQGGSAVIVRIHHCYADGVALIQVLLALCNATSRPDPCCRPSSSSLTSDLARLIPASLSDVLRGSADLLQTGVEFLLHPTQLSDTARAAIGLAGDIAHIALMPDDPSTSLKRPLSGVRRAAWASPIKLDELRSLGHFLGCTVNDVLISTLAGALGRHLEHQGDPIAGLTIRATVPVNLRSPAEQSTLGNRFGLMFVELPIGIRDPLERLWKVHDLIANLKDSKQAVATFGMLSAIGSLPAVVEEPAIAVFSSKASLVVSNLPGPRDPLLLAGVPVSQVLFWVPQAGAIGTGVSMLTYCGQVQLGVIADRQLVAEPDALIEAIAAEFERLVYLVLLGAGSLLN